MRVERLSAVELDGKQLPVKFTIFSEGENKTSKGDFVFDEIAAASVMDGFGAHGMGRLPLDFDHGMLSLFSSPESGVAAGWFVPEVFEGSLIATDVQWTPRAQKALRDREFRFISPAFRVDEETNRILGLVNVALTNLPATVNATPLVAKANVAPESPLPNEGKQKGAAMQSLLNKLSAANEAEAVRIVDGWKSITDELLSATGARNLDGAIAAAKANAGLVGKVAELSQEIEGYKSRDAERGRDDLIKQLSSEGKLPPALHDWARTQSVETLNGFGKAAPAIKTESTPSGEGAAVVLSAEDERVIEAMQLNRDDFIKERQEQNKARRGGK